MPINRQAIEAYEFQNSEFRTCYRLLGNYWSSIDERLTDGLATIHPELQRPGRVGTGNAHWPVGVNRGSRSADGPWKVPWALRLINCSGGGALLRQENGEDRLGSRIPCGASQTRSPKRPSNRCLGALADEVFAP